MADDSTPSGTTYADRLMAELGDMMQTVGSKGHEASVALWNQLNATLAQREQRDASAGSTSAAAATTNATEATSHATKKPATDALKKVGHTSIFPIEVQDNWYPAEAPTAAPIDQLAMLRNMAQQVGNIVARGK